MSWVGMSKQQWENPDPQHIGDTMKEKIQQLGRLFGETVSKDGQDPILIEKGKRKTKEWGEAPGLIIVTWPMPAPFLWRKKFPSVLPISTGNMILAN